MSCTIEKGDKVVVTGSSPEKGWEGKVIKKTRCKELGCMTFYHIHSKEHGKFKKPEGLVEKKVNEEKS